MIGRPTITASPKPSPRRRRSWPMGERAPAVPSGLTPLSGSCISPHASPPGAPEANSAIGDRCKPHYLWSFAVRGCRNPSIFMLTVISSQQLLSGGRPLIQAER
jgi:hypothetical protein